MMDLTRRYKRLLSQIKIAGVGLIVVLVTGIGLAGCGGDGDEPPDYQSLLKEASRYVADIEKKNAKLNAKLEDLNDKLKGKKSETDEDYGDEAFDILMTENQTLKEEKDALVAEIGELKREEERVVTEQVAGLEAKNKSLADKKAVYEEEIAKLRKKVKANEELAETVADLKKENDTLADQKTSLEKEIADLRAELVKAEALAQKIEELEKENKALSELNTAIKSRMEKIQKIMADDNQNKSSRKHKK